MIQTTTPADPDIHRAACVIARRFVNLLSGILRDDEKNDATNEAYAIARSVMEELAVFKGGK